MRSSRLWIILSAGLAVGLVIGLWQGSANHKATLQSTTSAPGGGGQPSIQAARLPQDAMDIVKERGLSPADVSAAVATFMPTGKLDEYVMFASGGHSGQMFAIGLPSMRLLRTIAVFTPEPWQGYGYGVKESPMGHGADDSRAGLPPLRWADTHHPGLSETNGEYDGQYLFIGDKANGRMGVIDLRDFETKQIVANPVFVNNHGAAFVTPNTDYVFESSQYAAPLGGKYAPISQYQQEYRGFAAFWKFNRDKGRIMVDESFAIELPPYWQDLADAGKLVSDGWVFFNSFNTEMATGGVESGNPPFEAGASERDMDYMHVINWKKAAQVVAAGKVDMINGFKVIRLPVAIAEGLLYFIPEPKSPHGVDICPEGTHIVVAGKLDPHVTIYNFNKIQDAIAKQDFEGKDSYGVPIIRFDSVKEAQVELGLGPLHTQFDNQGYAYTSLFLESAVARWTMGDCKYTAPEKPWSLVSKVPVHFNVGHIAAAEGDTVSPDGKYLVSLNKWSVDRFLNVGPLLPQNLQLVDVSKSGDTMQVLYDMPIGMGEPHYAQIIKADKLKAWEVYPEVGWNPLEQAKSADASLEGKIERHGDTVEVYTASIRSHFDPEHVEVTKGQHVIWHITNLERTRDATHGFTVPGYNIAASIEPGETATVEFIAAKEGVFPFYCLEFCSALHLEMAGYFLVKPPEAEVAAESSAAPSS
ncbi:MAG: Sec-dependent nitrous-oxide reductase [Candidatus Omnitrophica bacterium]|nr:Sec-dependent nitrous-oxide reductase [Candidatus Omnitrophota bacterium]